jgi:hypothetical protein
METLMQQPDNRVCAPWVGPDVDATIACPGRGAQDFRVTQLEPVAYQVELGRDEHGQIEIVARSAWRVEPAPCHFQELRCGACHAPLDWTWTTARSTCSESAGRSASTLSPNSPPERRPLAGGLAAWISARASFPC